MPSPLPTHPTSPSFHDAAPELAELLRHLPLHVLAPLLGRVRREAWKARQQVVRPLEMLEAIEDGIRVMAHEVPGGGALHELVEREGLLALGAAVQEAGVLVHALTDPSPVSTCVDLIATDADALTDAQRLALRAEVERLLPEAHAAMALQASKAGAGATKDPLDMTQAEREAELAAIARLWFRLPWATRDGTPAQSAAPAPGATNATEAEAAFIAEAGAVLEAAKGPAPLPKIMGWLATPPADPCGRVVTAAELGEPAPAPHDCDSSCPVVPQFNASVAERVDYASAALLRGCITPKQARAVLELQANNLVECLTCNDDMPGPFACPSCSRPGNDVAVTNPSSTRSTP